VEEVSHEYSTLGAATAVLVATLAVVAVGCSATPTSSPSTTTSTPANRIPPSTIADPWSTYWTSVNPGSAIDFVTARTGWRLDGQLWGPRLDGSLGSGVVDNGSAWPGTSIEETTDGGKSWSTILHVTSGIWGMDLVSRDVGFAVGVTSLRITSDGGKRWRQVSEPAGHPLVWVEFNTSELGYGLTTTGTLVRSVDAGSSWSSTGMTTTATAACFASAWVGYVADRSGDLYATHDGGRSWAEVERAPFPAGTVRWSLERPVVQRHEHLARPAADLCCRLCCNQPVPRYTQRRWRLLVVDNRK